jgi:hypothetical protein
MAEEGDVTNVQPRRRILLRSLFERVLPPGDYPGAWEGPVGTRVTREVEADEGIPAGLDRLDAEAAAVFGQGFPELHTLQQDELLDRMELDQVRTRWDEPTAAAWLSAVVNLVGRAYTEGGEGNASNASAADRGRDDGPGSGGNEER